MTYANQIILILLLILTGIAITLRLFLNRKNPGKLSNVSVSSVVFAFDLHNVIIKPDIYNMVKKAFLELNLWAFLTMLDPIFWYNVIRYGSVPEDLIDKLSKKYGNHGLTKTFFINILNTFYIDQKMLHLIKELKKNGYQIYLASNIWPELWDNLIKKLPELNNIFDAKFNPIPDSYILKPNPQYFQKIRDYLHQNNQSNKTIIFIDNNDINLDAAQKEGFVALKFHNYNDLKQQLIKLGFTFLD